MTINLATGLIVLANSLSGAIAGAQIGSATDAKPLTIPIPSIAVVADRPITLESYIREYFRNEPILAEIAGCETRFRHFGANGRVIRGDLSLEDIGVMQINEFYHGDRARILGFDLRTLDGNLAYARWLYVREGAKPWFASSKCWLRYEHLANATNPTALSDSD
jgi:hypothetical protein